MLVTGASGGIGVATACALADEGARALAEAPFEAIEHLHVHTNAIGPEGSRALSLAAHLPAEQRERWALRARVLTMD